MPLTRLDKIHDMSHLAYAILERENHPDIASQVMVLKIWVSTGLGDFDIYGCVSIFTIHRTKNLSSTLRSTFLLLLLRSKL